MSGARNAFSIDSSIAKAPFYASESASSAELVGGRVCAVVTAFGAFLVVAGAAGAATSSTSIRSSSAVGNSSTWAVPPAAKGLLGRLRLLPIALHDLRATDANLALYADWQHPHSGLEVDDLDDGVRRRQPDAARPRRGVAHLHGAERRRFGEAVSFARGDAGEFPEPMKPLDGQRCAARCT